MRATATSEQAKPVRWVYTAGPDVAIMDELGNLKPAGKRRGRDRGTNVMLLMKTPRSQ